MKPVTEQEKTLFPKAVSLFFFTIKMVLVVLCLFVAILIVSQSAVAPVSTRLLSTYAVEYALHKVKPYRVYFPQPYMVTSEKKKTR